MSTSTLQQQEDEPVGSTPASTQHRSYSPQLDGLRAIAIVLILLFHLGLEPFESGFLGVDVFFVISGFLITTLLLAEARRTGRISLADFWSRRARRLFPALVVLLLVIAVSAAITATVSERQSLRGDLLATATYVANWRFIGTSSYFANVGIESPLEHAWALAVEVQFYLVWPLAVAGSILAFRRRPVAMAVVAGVGAAASAWLLFARWDPTAVERAYMGTDARIFEPLIGAIGAIVVTTAWARGTIERHAALLAAISAAGLAVAIALIGSDGPGYYAGGAVALSVMTMLLVATVWCANAAGFVGRGLRWAPLVWIGAISYGIYLWHWPIILWLDARDPNASALLARRAAAVVLTIGVAAISYYLIEEPIRRGRTRRGAHRAGAGALRRPRNILIAVPVTILLLAGVSMAATSVPPVADASLVVMMAGDSVPKQLIPALERETADSGWRFVDAAAGGCPVTGEDPVDPSGVGWTTEVDCRTTVTATQDRLMGRTAPDLVIWWDRASISNFRSYDDEVVFAGTARYWRLRSRALDETVRRLTAGGAMVVLMATEPPGANMKHDAWGQFQIDRYADVTARWDDMLRAYARAHPATTMFVDLGPLVCRADTSPCDDTIDGVTARPDGQHYQGPGQAIAIAAIVSTLEDLVARREQDVS
ncbi:MAG TPA: acyltransferase family protein [Actinomycetota bacterium]|nr:acyltransferase family protein [Actinomycetota bacterium]